MLTPKELKPGYLVRFEDGSFGTVQYHRWGFTRNEDAKLSVIAFQPQPGLFYSNVWPVSALNAKFEFGERKISAVYGHSLYLEQNRLDRDRNLVVGRDLLWERKETKKMTVAEICKELGYDVEIVKDGATDA